MSTTRFSGPLKVGQDADHTGSAAGYAGEVHTYSPTISKGVLVLKAADSAGNTATTITNASQSGARTYTIPDAGVSTANFVLDSGAYTVSGSQTFTGGVHIDTGTKTVAATSGAATLNKYSGVVTSESITTAAGADYTLTLTNSTIAAADVVLASVKTGTNTTVGLNVHEVTPGPGSCTFLVRNGHASSALNGTVVVSYVVFKA